MRILLLTLFLSCSITTDGEDPGNTNSDGLLTTKVVTTEDIEVNFSKEIVFRDLPLSKTHKLIKMDGVHSNIEIQENGGKFIYHPHHNYSGADLVRVFWENLSTNEIVVSELILEVRAVADNPNSSDDLVNLESNDEILVNVLENDIDVDGDPITINEVESIEGVSTTIENNRIKVNFDENFDLESSFEISYTIADNTGRTSSAKLHFNKTISEIDSNKIPIRIVFVNSSQTTLSEDVSADADLVLKTLNEKINRDGSSSFFQFEISEAIEVEDNLVHVHCDPRDLSCNDFENILDKYGKVGEVSLVFVKEIQGNVAGIAKLNRVPESKESTVVSEYSKIGNEKGTVYSHEIGHMLGFDHTHQIGIDENQWISYSSCLQDISYLQRGGELSSNPFEDQNGVLWDDFHNTMKSVTGSSSDDLGFFTSGYDLVFPRIISCYRART